MAPHQSVDTGDPAGPADRHDPATERLLLALTSLYVQRPVHSAEEQRQYDELVLRFVAKVRPATRAAVAAMLRRHPGAPAGAIERLGGAPGIDDDSLDDGPPHVAPEQPAADDPPAESAPSAESDRRGADRDCEPASALSDVPPAAPQPPPLTAEAGEAFFAASSAERCQLLSLLAMRGVAAPEGSRRFHVRIDPAAWRGRPDAFLRDFERLIDAPRCVCERILNDPSGEPLVIAARATGMPAAMLQRILLLVSPATNHSVRRVYELTELYHGLDSRAARDLLAAWRKPADAGDRPPQAALAVVTRQRGTNLGARFAALNARLEKQAATSHAAKSPAGRQDKTS